MSHVNKCHVSHAWVCPTCFKLRSRLGLGKWVMPHIHAACHICMGHVMCEYVMSIMNESCHIRMIQVTCDRVMSHMYIRMGHVTCERVMSHMSIRMGHVTCERVMSRMNTSRQKEMSHVTHEGVTSPTIGVATISRLLQIICLFCRISSLL